MDTTTKVKLSEGLREELADCSAFVIVGYSGLTVADTWSLRGKFRQAGCRYRVYKNSTVRFAITDTKHDAAREYLKGVTALCYHPEDPGAPARVARDFAKDHDNFYIKGGIVDGELLDHKGVLALASLPGPRELKAQFLALLNTPATNLVRVMNAPGQNFLNVLNAKKDKDAA